MARIHDDRQECVLLHRGNDVQVKDVPRVFARGYALIPLSHRTILKFPSLARYSAAPSHSQRFAAIPRFNSTGLPLRPAFHQQGVVLHIARTDLQHIGVFGDLLDLPGVHHFG